MSGLAALLAGRVPAGVYLWHTPWSADEVAVVANQAGWACGYVDGWTQQSKPAVLAGIAEALGFGEHFGHNLDALADSLRDLPGPTVLLWDGWTTLAGDDERTTAVILEILAERSDPAAHPDWPPFAALLRGPTSGSGAAPALPTLD